ncbi:MAG: hypothetical protein MJ249_14935, partial [Kiritimatiellae bacterium]|nr:hypothetical protein [Kiritimatiellia bacterium]
MKKKDLILISQVGRGACWLVSTLCLQAFGIGYSPDPQKYQQALDAIVVDAREDFARQGLEFAPGVLNTVDCEIVDSFLKGRDFYRIGREKIPLEPKLPRLAELLGLSYAERERSWRRMVKERTAKQCRPLTRQELQAKIEALEQSKEAPVHLDSGLCRSSSGREAVETVCTRCGKHTVYSEVDEIDHEAAPDYYRKIAEELRNYGIVIEVDGTASCPDCCTYPCDFKLSEFPGVVRLRKDIDLSKERDCPDTVRFMKPGLEMRVVKVAGRNYTRPGYVVRTILPEAWVKEEGGWYQFYMVPGEGYICGVVKEKILKFAEPREEVTVPRKGKFVKVLDAPYYGFLFLEEHLVEVVRRTRSSQMHDIPPTFLIVNGHRVPASEHLAEALLAFAQDYRTAYYGHFDDQFALKKFAPFFRKVFLDDSRWDIPPHIKSTPEVGGTVRWCVDQDWYFKDWMPRIRKELDRLDAHPREVSVELEPEKKGGRVKWNLFGATPDQWDGEVSFGVCGFTGMKKCRHFVLLVTSVEGDSAKCLVYETTNGDSYEFWEKWKKEINTADLNYSSVAEIWSHDPEGADVLIVTPWLRRG